MNFSLAIPPYLTREVVLGINISNLEGNQSSQSLKMTIFYNCQTGGHVVYDINRKPLYFSFFTTDYDIFTRRYRLFDIDFPVISTKNCNGKRIVIPGPECMEVNSFASDLFGMNKCLLITNKEWINVYSLQTSPT